NSVSYLYKYCSYVSFSGLTEDEALEALMDNECEVENIESDEDVIMITGAPGDLDYILESLKSLGKELEFYSDSVIWLPSSNIDLSEDDLRKFKHFLSMTDAIDDVQEVYHNVNLPEEE
ncbi:MAG: YebC/PmpR family DNA-binding transcriptional regulator, partial [Candidatus Izemoplasmatales bacterium]|nr:YebC/PmpR family DNA-binding transcriptional regulator [Candidatus Izemoplasmatales bacterium]